ncbi:MAG: hypothetical protein PHW83_11875 [Bacteroidales bacterium]|nr:hypothetical protein [Bacteroidales bacterium]
MNIAMGFKIEYHIPKIFQRLKDEGKENLKDRLKCGSLSALSILEFFKVQYDIEKFIIDSNDGDSKVTMKLKDGSTILDITYALANTGLVDVELYIKDDDGVITCEEDENQLKTDNEMRSKINSIDSSIIRPPISIDDVLLMISDNSIPILGFHKNGDLTNPHFSPLRGMSGPFLLFPLDIKDKGDCNVRKDDFIKTWWTEEREFLGVIIVRKK